MIVNTLKYVLTGGALLTLFLNGCSPDENLPVQTGSTPQITDITAPEKWNSRSNAYARIEVRVIDPQGPGNLAGVVISLHEHPGDNLVFSDSLHDDGAYFHPQSGDVLAGDGVYANTFRASEMIGSSANTDFTFRFHAVDKDGNRAPTAEQPVIIGANSLPEIRAVSTPDTLTYAGLENLVFYMTVSDSDGVDDITHAWFESRNLNKDYVLVEEDLFNDGDLVNHGDESGTDSVFSARIADRFYRGKMGDYDLRFRVEDSFGDQNISAVIRRIHIVNQPPLMSGITVPASIQIPSESGTYRRELLSASVTDTDGLADIDSVYFYSRKPDSTLANNGLPIVMVDNGLPFNIDKYWEETGDETGGDGIYSFSLLVMDTQNPGDYTFSFFVRDKAGNRYGPVSRTVSLIRN